MITGCFSPEVSDRPMSTPR